MGTPNLRKPAAAGQFYPSCYRDLKQTIEGLIDKEAGNVDALAAVLPHAGYAYSGRVAGETVSRLKVKDKIILLGPNHTGYGAEFSIVTKGSWQTPLGKVEIDTALAEKIMAYAQCLKDDPLAHEYEHSLEVELPLLQYFKADFKFVPIAILSDNIIVLRQIGRGIASAIKECDIKSSTLILASSDLTHYEPETEARRKDKQAIEAILTLKEDKLQEKIRSLGISMCGYAAVAAMLTAVNLLGAQGASLIKYQTSAEITGDKSSVVGYAGILIH